MQYLEHIPDARREREQTALREAANQRLVAAARRAGQPNTLHRTRRTVGHGLVRLGERLAGTEPQHA